MLLFYAGGVTAVAANRYEALLELMNSPMTVDGEDEPLVCAATDGLGDRRLFRVLTGHERKHVPLSEHLHEFLRPLLDETLLLGSDFERAFDRFEILTAVEYAHREDRGWAPLGRFGWKLFERETSPLKRVIKEAETAKDNWPPVRAGLCGGSYERFSTAVQQLMANVSRHSMA
jgi:hypothetical protein